MLRIQCFQGVCFLVPHEISDWAFLKATPSENLNYPLFLCDQYILKSSALP